MPSQCPLERAENTLLRISLLRILLLFLVITAPCPSFAARELDGFNINIAGTATITGEVHAVAVQPWDGQIIIGGNFTLTEMVDVSVPDEPVVPKVPGVVRSNLARLNNDGSVDTAFAPEPDGPVYAIVIEQDRTDPTKAGQSRIYIGGDYDQIAGVARGGLARLGAAGGVPDSFAPAAAGTVVNAMLLQPNNRRVVVGGTFAMMDGTACSNLAAISIAAGTDGDLLQTFSGGTNDAVHALLLQEGYLVVGGSFTAPRKHLARFDPEDLLDGAFSAEPEGVVRSLALQPDGMILVGGDFTTISTSLAPLQPRRYLARLTSEGQLDSFDPLLEEFEAAGVNRVAAIAVQPDGKILAAGRFTKSTGNAAKPQQYHLARFQLNGAFDPGIDTKSNDAINAIVLEPNGRFLVGGKFTSVVTAQGVRARTGLARFYFHGGLDDDGAPFPPSVVGMVRTLALHPDGSVTIGGDTTGGPGKTRIAKLDPDLNLVPGYGDGVLFNHWTRLQSLRADGKHLVGGWFTDPRVLLAQLTKDGTLDTFTTFLDAGPLLQTASSWIEAAVLLPKVSRTSRPVGTMASEGMMYLALTATPKGKAESEASHSLVRVTATGALDPTFGPIYFDRAVEKVTLQDDGKILVGGEFSEMIVRLHSNGDKDTDFQPWRPFGGYTRVDGITVLKDGNIIVNGVFDQIISPDSTTTKPFTTIYKLRSDGSLDDTFHSLITYTYWDGWVQGVTVLNDQTMILHGLFDHVNGLDRTCIVRVSQKGEVVGPNPLLFWTDFMLGTSVVGIGVQPDGKIIAGGSFDLITDGSPPMNRLDARFLTRMSNIFWGTEEVVVAPGGSSITWLRGGTGPELWQVWFEEKSDAPGAEWEYLGAGVPVDGGWKISLPAPEAAPKNGQLTLKQNRYVRARGYGNSVGLNSGNSTLVESVRQYYLKEPIKVRAEAQTKVYGDDNPASYTAAYFDAGGEPIVPAAGTFFGTPTFSTPRTPTSPVGSYAVTADVSGMSSPIYSFIPEEGTLTVTKRPASVEPDDIDRVYGQAVGYGGTLSGFLPGDNVTATYSHAGGNSVAGSPHIISATLQPAGVLGNYDIAYGTGDLRFSPKDASVRPTGLTRNYGDPVVLTGTLEGFLPGDNVTATYSREAGDSVAGSPYSISATLEPVSVLGNYNITYHPADLTFTKKDASVTPADLTKVYGEPVELSGTLEGFLASDNVTATYSRVAGNTVAGSPYSISATLSPVEVLDNYNITYNTGNLTFTKKDASVTPAPLTKVYGEPVELSGTLDGFLPGDNVTALYSREPGNSVAGSPYSISATLDPVAALDNYNITYNTADFTITKKTASVTPHPASKEYGSSAAEIFTGTLSGFLAADNVTAVYSRAAGNTVTGGPYAISATLSPAELLGNYDITYNTAPFTITKKAASVAPSGGNKVYGTPGPDPLSGTLSGFLAADGVTASYSRVPGETVAGSPYAITATLAPAAVLENYDIAYGTAGFSIAKKAASVTPVASSKEYGAADPEPFTGALSGFLPSDGVTASYTRTPGETSAGSPYAISATLGPAEVLTNYDITYNTAGFVIGKKAATVTAVSATKVYGEADPPLLGEGSGFLAADLGPAMVTLNSSRPPGENAGAYVLTPVVADGGTGLLGNYNVTLVPGSLTILKAPLTITAQDKSRRFGAPDPAFTAAYSGLVGSDTPDSLGGIPAFTTTADAASPSGTYPIVPALGTITSTNYEFSFVNGILTVQGGAPQSITFNPMRPKTYGDGDFDPGARASSDLPVSYASSAPGVAAVVGEKIRVLAPGYAEITASQGGDENFAAAEDVTRGLVVNPPPWNGVGFDGSDDLIEVADAPQLDFGAKNGFSIETWLYLDGSQPDGTGLLSKGEGGDPWSGYQLILHQNRIAAEIGEGTVTVGPADGLAGSSNLADGRWHHVAVAVDRVAATATLYLDGRVEAEVAHAALRGNPDNAAALVIGRERSGSRFFKGRIDEVRLWDSVRSRDEVRASVSQIIDPLDEPHLVAYFHLDEGDAGLDNAPFATAPERTSYAANGTLRNFGLTGTGSNWISSGAFLPLLETSAVGSITSDGATAGGNVYPNYYPAAETGFCWGTSPDPGEGDNCSSYGSGPGPFTGAVTGLDPGTTYHLRGYAKNQIGTAYGNDVTFQTARLDQIITFGALEERVYGDAPFLLNGSSSGGLALTYTSSAADVAEVAGDQVRIKGAGSATITAWQAGNATYNAAPPVAQSFVVQKRAVTVSADNQSRAYLAENPLLTASYQGILPGEEGAVTGLPLLSTAATPASPVGSYQITAGLGTLSAANYRFVFAAGVLTVRPAAQQITFNPMRPKTFGDGDFDPGATASSALPVAYASAAPGVAAVAGNRLKVVAPGTAAITASQSGSEQFDAAQNVTCELVVNPPPWNGLKFDGSDDLVRVADGAQLAFGSKTGFTLESWLYLDGAQPEGSGVLSKGEGGSAWSGFNLFLHQDRIAAEIGYGADSVGIAEGLIGSSTLNDGQWHHVALSVDRVAATASLYLDGRLEARLQNPLLGGSPDNLNPLQIGVDRSGSRFFKGRIDELRLWGSARSREEIRGSLSQIIDPQEEPDLAAYFHLDEGDAGLDSAAFATAPERTAHAADGALLNFTLDGADSNWVRSGAFLPLLETAPVTLITSSAATGGGTIYPNYYPATDYGLCWSSAPNPSLSDSCSHSGSGTGPFLGLIAGLTPGATYHARGFATNRMGTAYGNDVTFQAARLDQSITFGPIGERTYGDPGFPLVASASSSLPITYASSDSSVAVVENGIIIPRGAGRAVITASQGGDQSYNAAAAVSQPFVVNKKQLTVSADAKSRAYRTPNPPFTVSFQGFATGENSGVVSGAAQLTTVASLDSSVGSYPIVVGVGSLSADNYRFLPVNGTLTVFQSCQEIVFPSLGDRTYGDPPVAITASSCSGLGLSFASSNPLVATVSGNLLTITGAGSSVITASQRGSGDLEQAPDVSQTLVVHKRGQVIAFPPLPQKLLGDDPLLLAATASSGLPVSYASSDPAVAAVSGSTLTIAGTGTAVVTARQEGSANFHPALPASQPFTVALEGTLPTLRLSALPSGSATASPVINVTGSAQDDSGITSLTVNDADLTGSAALFSRAVPLTVGENSITVSARDGAGNVASETLSVTLDATAPAIAVAEPADNSVTDQSLFTAKGTVPAGSTVTMAVNGAAPQPLAVTSGTFTGTGYLQAGLNTVELKALLSGRSALAKRSVTLAAGAPPVAITDPGEDLRTEADATLIRGRVGTQAGLTVRLEVNGAAHTPAVEGGVFQQQIAMDRAGEYRITVTASDSDGNSSGTQRNIIKVDRIAGDLDRDGVVDIGDAIALLRISLGIDPVTDHAVLHGDVAPIINGVSQPDGKIGVGDVLVLLRKIVGLIE